MCSYESGPSAYRRAIPRYRGSESFKVYAVDWLPATTDFARCIIIQASACKSTAANYNFSWRVDICAPGWLFRNYNSIGVSFAASAGTRWGIENVCALFIISPGDNIWLSRYSNDCRLNPRYTLEHFTRCKLHHFPSVTLGTSCEIRKNIAMQI